ncbi:MAG: COX15/CtaA family protein [Phycisphaerales bacterium]|nr:COX15/CtaA family protein [Phycisphaerales bacterium]
MTHQPSPTAQQHSILGPTLVAGFAGLVAALVAWFVSHSPMVQFNEPLARGVVITCWGAALIAVVRFASFGRPLAVGAGAGLVSAVVGAILIAGTRTRSALPEAAPAPAAAATPTLAVALGFVGIGIVLGMVAGLLARKASAPPSPADESRWLARFAIVTACAMAPLLFIGGLVTSTGSGMAVPDWPTTFGSNMLNYPLGPKSPQDVFLEHSHRLFGMLVGLASLILMVWVLIARVPGWPRLVSIVAFLLVCVQGVIGGVRVRHDSRPLAMLHGILAQLVFALSLAIAAYLSPSFKDRPESVDPRTARKLKRFATGLLHSLVVQLILGALARHFRKGDHSLWAHAAFSIIVFGFAAMAGFAAQTLPRRTGCRGITTLRATGIVLVAVVTLQFILGWSAFAVRGQEIKADSTLEALIRTAHQANGALLLAAATLMFVWARWLNRAARASQT